MDELPIRNGRYDGKEGLHLEFKSASKGIPKSTWDTYSSFANTFGGRIILGINDETNEIEGVPNADLRIQELWNTLNNPEVVNLNILSENDIWTFESDGKTLIIMDVPRADRFLRPIYHLRMETGTYRRNGEGDYRCRMPEIASMLRDRDERTYDTGILEHLSFDDLDLDTLHSYRNIISNYNPQHRWDSIDDVEFALKIGAMGIKDGKKHLTIAGLLMFGKEHVIYQEFPNFKLDYREYMDMTPSWIFRMVTGDGLWEGNVLNFFLGVSKRLSSGMDTAFAVDERMVRIIDTDIHKATRECFLNALIHADYRGKLTVKVEKRVDSIMISNSGLFRIPLEVAEKGGESDPRNAIIAKMFGLIGMVERAGLGVNYVMNTWRDSIRLEPQVIENVERQEVDITMPFVTRKRSNDIIDGILNLMSEDPKISKKKMAEILGVSEATISNKIGMMKKNGMITREGGTRGTWYVDGACHTNK